MADEETPSGSIEDRISHKNWRWRVSGFEELTIKFKNSFETTGSLFNEHGPNFKKYLSDINPMVQEKVLDTLSAFIDRCDVVKTFAPSFVPTLVEKCFSSTRPKVKDKTVDVLIATIEADSPEPVIENLLKGTTSSSLKVSVASLIALRESLKTFGPKVINIKSIMKQYQPWFENRDKNVREEASNLIVEVYRWMKQGLLPLLDSLTPIQLKTLNEQFEKLPGDPAVPLKYMRSEAAKAQAAAAKSAKGGAVVVEVEEIDPYSMIDAVNILSKIGPEFYEGMESKKWQERQAQVDMLVDLLNSSPKIENGDFRELVSVLKKTLSDTNVMIVTKAIVAIGLMGEGLRNHFTQFVKGMVIPIMERYKEKKPQVVPAVHTTMNQLVSRCVGISDIIDELIALMANKVAQIKIETLNFLHKAMSTTKKPQDITKVAKQLAKSMMDCLNDTAEPVRDAAAKTFALFSSIIGERGMAPYFNQLDPIKLKKVKDLMPTAPTPVAASAGEPDDDEPASSSKKPASKSSTSAKSTTTTTTTTTASYGGGLDDLAAKLSKTIPREILSGLESQNLNDRADSTKKILDIVQSSATDCADTLIQYLQEKPGWKEANFQVMNNMLAIIGQLANSDSTFTKQTITNCVGPIIEKLTDVKLKDTANSTLSSICEAVSPQVVFQLIYPVALNNKNAKLTESALAWMAVALEEFGVQCFNYKPLFDFLKGCLESISTPVKTSAIKVLCVLRIAIGSAVFDYVADIKRQILDTIDKEFSKIKDQRPPAASRQSRVENEIPRTDISSKLGGIILTNLSDNDWKQRQAALEEIERFVVDANLKLQPKLGNLVSCLAKGSLTDKNQKVITTTLTLINMLTTAVGPSFDKSAKMLLPGVLALLADAKKPLRDSALATMTIIAEELGTDIVLPALATLLLQESATSRKDALTWAVANVGNAKSTPEMTQLAKPIIACLQDKNAEVRANSEQLLSIIASVVPADAFKKEMRDVKPANQPNMQAIIDRHYISTKKAGAAAAVAKQPVAKLSPSRTSTGKSNTTTTTTNNSPSRISTTKLQSPQPVVEPSGDIILYDAAGKATRQKASQGQSFYIQETEEIVEFLQEQVCQCFSEEFANMMFSANPTHQQQVVDLLASIDSENFDLLASVLDVVFKWCSFKLFDVGASSLRRTTKLIEIVASNMKELEYYLSDYEAGCIVPVISEKLGTSNETFKQMLRPCQRILSEVTPPNSFFKYTLETTAKTNNWRTRVEGITEMGNIINQHGPAVAGNQLKPVVAVMAKVLSDRDPAQKQAAINSLSQLHAHIGDEIWKYLTVLSPADRQQLEQIFGQSNQSPNRSQHQSQMQSASGSSDDEETNIIIEYLELLKNFSEQTIDTVVELLKMLSNLIAGTQSTTFAEKFLYYNEEYQMVLTTILTSIFPRVFNDQSIFRLCKYLIHTIITIYSHDLIAKKSSVRALQSVLRESITLLVSQPSLPQKQDDLDWVTKALNQVLLRTLQKSDPTTLFSVLLRMITETRVTDQKNDKYNDLLLRCLLRATKSLKGANSPIEIDMGVVLLEISNYERTPGPDDSTKKTTRTLTAELININQAQVVQFCKKLVASNQSQQHSQLFALLEDLMGGKATFEKLVGVPQSRGEQVTVKSVKPKQQQQQPQPVHEELDIAQLGVAPLATPEILQQPNLTIPKIAPAPTKTTSTLDQQMSTVDKSPRNYTCSSTLEKKDLLQDIFKKVGNKERTTEGLYDLYYFKKQYPDYDISHNLSQTTLPFQSYITRNLQKIATELESNKTKEAPEQAVNYHEKLRDIQNTMHHQQQQQLDDSTGSSNSSMKESNQLTASAALNTLQRLRGYTNQNNNNTASDSNAPTTTTTTLPSTTSRTTTSTTTGTGATGSQDLTATVASLRQRLAHIKETSRSNE
ncbi:XMAP215 family protein [Heterostelium album PN500]|uniref:XMAP215 family protein n=1 Tax=Heterostelium pallidum (strain ATCC 26659 / Pp 5 / PN500) TaxID=670386 RepID=D3BU59_HETP5|nr:XMAP215 family protein [Heterostelium album PN500]EFA75060.1 XMAP215 family protein [Heterostelium album PN500]|eukprot:XP_020427194.1 XMAP215 family protein [Heterostelium album PN500]